MDLLHRRPTAFTPPAGAALSGAALSDAAGDPSGAADTNPWVAAVERGRTEFAGAFGDLARSRRNWQLVAFGALGIAAVMGTGLVTLATQARITPYVVEVDKLGRAQSFGRADRVPLADRRVVTSQVATWVRDIRAVVTDPVAQQDMVRRAYAFVDQSTAQFLQAYMTDPARDPRLLGKALSRVVEVTSVLPLPGAGSSGGRKAAPITWKVSWTETDYPLGGGPTTSTAWEGYVTTRQTPPTSADRVELNPLGIYVTAVNWTQVAGGEPDIGGDRADHDPDDAGA